LEKGGSGRWKLELNVRGKEELYGNTV